MGLHYLRLGQSNGGKYTQGKTGTGLSQVWDMIAIMHMNICDIGDISELVPLNAALDQKSTCCSTTKVLASDMWMTFAEEE